MIREVGESVGEAVFGTVGRVVGRTQEQRSLPADLLEDETAYLVVFDAPGVEPADVQVRFEDGEIRVRLDRFREFHEDYQMRLPGRGLSLTGRARLPGDDPVDPEEASATLEETGVLSVEIPKLPRPDDEEIPVESDDETAAPESEGETEE